MYILKKLIIIKTGHILDIFSKDRDESGTKTNSAVLRLTNILNNAGARDAIYNEMCDPTNDGKLQVLVRAYLVNKSPLIGEPKRGHTTQYF